MEMDRSEDSQIAGHVTSRLVDEHRACRKAARCAAGKSARKECEIKPLSVYP